MVYNPIPLSTSKLHIEFGLCDFWFYEEEKRLQSYVLPQRPPNVGHWKGPSSRSKGRPGVGLQLPTSHWGDG